MIFGQVSDVPSTIGAAKYPESQGFAANPGKTLRFLTRLRVGDSLAASIVVNSREFSAIHEMAMRPKSPEAPTGDLFRNSLEAIIDPAHELIRLAALIDWARFDDAFGAHYHDRKGRPGLPTRLMVGVHLLKHMKGLSDEETCAAWLENPYFQAFCGETHFQHRVVFDRSSMTPSQRCLASPAGQGVASADRGGGSGSRAGRDHCGGGQDQGGQPAPA